jgi:hypothetical protein
VETATTTPESATPGGSASGAPAASGGSAGTNIGETAGHASIKSLLALQKNLSCSINFSSKDVTRSGTIYVAAGLMRGTFFGSTKGVSQAVSMIDNGTTLYVWSRSTLKGQKFSSAVTASGSAAAALGGIDPTTDFDYVCDPWTVNAFLFVPPTNVDFS